MCFDGIVRRCFRSAGRGHFELYRLLSIFRRALRWRAVLFLPLRRASEDTGVFHGHFAIRQQRVDRIAGVLSVHHFLAIAVVHAAFVAELAVLVEDEDVRCGLRAVGAGDRLRFAVVEVGVVEMFVLKANFHFVETVADVGGVQFIDANALWDRWAEWRRRRRRDRGSPPPVAGCVARTFARSGSDCR